MRARLHPFSAERRLYEPKPKERIVFDEDLYYGDEGEEMAINDLMERDGLTEGEVREDFTDDEIFNHQMEMKDFDYEEEMRALAAFSRFALPENRKAALNVIRKLNESRDSNDNAI